MHQALVKVVSMKAMLLMLQNCGHETQAPSPAPSFLQHACKPLQEQEQGIAQQLKTEEVGTERNSYLQLGTHILTTSSTTTDMSVVAMYSVALSTGASHTKLPKGRDKRSNSPGCGLGETSGAQPL